MITLYGIPNCDSVKKARAWLAAADVVPVFHDFKKQGVPETQLDAWIKALGWRPLLNQRGTTWRRLGADVQASVQDAASAKALMLAEPSVIKRPVVAWNDPASALAAVTVGFTPQTFASALHAQRVQTPPSS